MALAVSSEFLNWFFRLLVLSRFIGSTDVQFGTAEKSVQDITRSRNRPSSVREARVKRRNSCHLKGNTDEIAATEERGHRSLDFEKVLEPRR